MTESGIERYLVKKIKDIEGMAIKLYAINSIGLPDRLILLPNKIIFFVELKTKTGRASIMQIKTHEALQNLGFKVYIANSKEAVNEIIEVYKK